MLYNNIIRSVEEYRCDYQGAEPFPYLVIDDAIDPAVLQAAVNAWPEDKNDGWKRLEKGKFSSLKRSGFNTASAPREIAFILGQFNTERWLWFLEEVAGIDGLIADKKFRGAGLRGRLNTATGSTLMSSMSYLDTFM